MYVCISVYIYYVSVCVYVCMYVNVISHTLSIMLGSMRSESAVKLAAQRQSVGYIHPIYLSIYLSDVAIPSIYKREKKNVVSLSLTGGAPMLCARQGR
jgi:hypothetical protein